MKGLILKPFWCEAILDYNKTWEIRRTNTKIRGKICLIKSGTSQIWGECEIIDSFPLTKELFENNYDKHLINCKYEELPNNYKCVWVLKNVKKYEKPIKYQHPRGAQIWVNIG